MRHFVVVYQYGKVASTSLVATLNALSDVEAVQAHFLGEESLREMVSLIVDPATSDYFQHHQVGQFIENARTTRLINAHRQGDGRDGALAIVSLYRDPFEWFRSSVLQDIAGYLPALEAIAGAEDQTGDGEARTGQALERALGMLAGIVAEFGGIDAVLEQRCSPALAHHPVFAGQPGLRPLFYTMLRPFSWFEAHYEPAIGCGLGDFAGIEAGVLYRKEEWVSLFVLRYESIDAQLGVVADRLGIGPVRELARENASGEKHMSGVVRDAFASEAARALKAQFLASDYARRFGYA